MPQRRKLTTVPATDFPRTTRSCCIHTQGHKRRRTVAGTVGVFVPRDDADADDTPWLVHNRGGVRTGMTGYEDVGEDGGDMEDARERFEGLKDQQDTKHDHRSWPDRVQRFRFPRVGFRSHPIHYKIPSSDGPASGMCSSGGRLPDGC